MRLQRCFLIGRISRHQIARGPARCRAPCIKYACSHAPNRSISPNCKASNSPSFRDAGIAAIRFKPETSFSPTCAHATTAFHTVITPTPACAPSTTKTCLEEEPTKVHDAMGIWGYHGTIWRYQWGTEHFFRDKQLLRFLGCACALHMSV